MRGPQGLPKVVVPDIGRSRKASVTLKVAWEVDLRKRKY